MREFTTSDGLTLHHLDAPGEGPPILCLPGLTRNAFDFDELAAALPGRRLIRLTFRGRSPSDYDPDWRNYAIGVEAGDVAAFLDWLGLDRVVIVGTSRGGLVAMALAATAKDRLAGVLLNDVGPEIAAEGLDRIRTYVGVAPRAASFEALAGGLGAMLGPQFPDLGPADWLRLARRWFVEGPDGRPALAYDPALGRAFGADYADPEPMWREFDALAGVPLAVVRGETSDILSRETLAEMARRRPDAIVAEVPRRGHVPFLDEPEALDALRGLLERVRA